MKRRAFVTLIGGAAAWPLAARAQQQSQRIRRVGVLMAVAESDADVRAGVARSEGLAPLTDQVRIGDQPQDGESSGAERAGSAARARRRGRASQD